MFPPNRIICLTEETVEALYLPGEQDRLVGISGYVVRPPQARREKPRVSAFTSANIDKSLALKPDLVLTFSDLQADYRRRSRSPWVRGPCVQSAKYRRDPRYDSDAGRDGRCDGTARQLAGTLETRLAEVRSRAPRLPKHPRVCVEEWMPPAISMSSETQPIPEINDDHWLVVRQEVPAGAGCDAGWLRPHSGRAAPRYLRNQIILDLGARAGRIDRWPCRA